VKRIYVGGTFDLLHPGHIELLRRAADLGNVWVALNTDAYAESFKGKRPVMKFYERVRLLEACRYVTMVVPCTGNEGEILEVIKPRYIVYANDGSYTVRSYLDRLKIDGGWLLDHGVELLFLDYTKGVSSTDIVARILQRHSCEPRQRDGAPEDAGEPDLPDPATGRGHCPCLGCDPCGTELTEGGFLLRDVPSP